MTVQNEAQRPRSPEAWLGAPCWPTWSRSATFSTDLGTELGTHPLSLCKFFSESNVASSPRLSAPVGPVGSSWLRAAPVRGHSGGDGRTPSHVEGGARPLRSSRQTRPGGSPRVPLLRAPSPSDHFVWSLVPVAPWRLLVAGSPQGSAELLGAKEAEQWRCPHSFCAATRRWGGGAEGLQGLVRRAWLG